MDLTTPSSSSSPTQYIFPILKHSEILQCLSELSIDLNKAELSEPSRHKEKVKKVFLLLVRPWVCVCVCINAATTAATTAADVYVLMLSLSAFFLTCSLFVDWNLLWSLGRRFFAKARGVSIVGISRTSWRTFGYKIHVGSSKVDDNMRHRWLWIQGPLLSNTQTIQMSTQCGH